MKSLLRPAAVVSSLTIFATYVYLQGSGRSLTELWSPATAEAGAPLSTSVSPDNGPTFVYREPGMPATKSMPLPIDVRPPSSVASGGYSSGIVPGSTSAPQWLPTPASNPVPATFPDPSAMRMLAGSKSLPMPVQVAPQATITITPADVAAAKPYLGPPIPNGSLVVTSPVTLKPSSLPTGAGPAGTVTPTADNPPIFSQSNGSYGWMTAPGASPVLSSKAPPQDMSPTLKAIQADDRRRMMSGTKAFVMPVQIAVPVASSNGIQTTNPSQPINESSPLPVLMSGSKSDVMPITISPRSLNKPRPYTPGQSLNAPQIAPQYPLFQGVPSSVPASNVRQQ